MWRSKIWSEEIQIRITRVTAWVWISKTTAIWGQPMGRSSSAWENTFVKWIGGEELSSPGILRRKLPRIWRLEKMLLSRGKYWENNKDWKNFLRSMIRDHEQCVYWWIKYENYKNDWYMLKTQKNLLWSWLTEQLRQYLRSSSSSCDLEFKRAYPRSWDAAKYKRIYGYYWTRFWSSTSSTRSWWNFWIIQEIWQNHWESLTMSRILRKEGIENSGSDGPLQSILVSWSCVYD